VKFQRMSEMMIAPMQDTEDLPLQLGRFRFEITGDEGLYREVVTRCKPLGQHTVMLASIRGIGAHPRFLLHDSPREGNLDRMLYEGFLGTLHDIHTALGGQDEAPFQYIVTTTTTPVKTVQDIVRMQLCAWPRERMLFQRSLGGQSQAHLDLFSREQEQVNSDY